MPKNENDIPMEEISSAVEQTNTSVQILNMTLDDMSVKFEKMTELMSMLRDHSRDEVREMSFFKDSISKAAEEARKLYGISVEGMDDFSVSLKAAEDRLGKAKEDEEKINEKIKDEYKKSSKLREATDGRLNKEKKKQLQEILNTEEASGAKLRKLAKEELSLIHQRNVKNRENLKLARDERDVSEKQLKAHQDIFKLAKGRFEQEQKISKARRSDLGLLDIASSLRLPGVSTAAQITRHVRRETPEGEGVGLGAKLLGMGRGAAIGGALAFGGAATMQGYRAYRMAHQMAPQRRRLMGMLGAEGEQAFRGEASGREMEQLGYGAPENVQFMQQFARQVGGRGARQQMIEATRLATGFGLERGELGGQAEAMRMSGAAMPGREVQNLEQVMSEGVKAGMDRARITTFTQQVIGLQEQILQISGENNAKAIAEAMGSLYQGSGRGESFFRGPEMQAIRSIDQMMRQVGRGAGGPGAGTLLRAFGFAPGGQEPVIEGINQMKPGKRYYEAMKFMEGGLFGGEQDEVKATDRVRRIIDQYTAESGGRTEVADVRMMRELGVGLTQIGKLRELMASIDKEGKVSSKHQTELKKIMDGMKDPSLRLLEEQAKQTNTIYDFATNADKAWLKIEEAITALNKTTADSAENIIAAFGGTRGKTEGLGVGEAVMGVGAVALLGKAVTKIPGIGKLGEMVKGMLPSFSTLGKNTDTIAKKMGGAASATDKFSGNLLKWGGKFLGVSAALGAGVAIGTGINKLIEQDETMQRENVEGGKFDMIEKGIASLFQMLPKEIASSMGIEQMSEEDFQRQYGETGESKKRRERIKEERGFGGGFLGFDPGKIKEQAVPKEIEVPQMKRSPETVPSMQSDEQTRPRTVERKTAQTSEMKISESQFQQLANLLRGGIEKSDEIRNSIDESRFSRTGNIGGRIGGSYA